MHVVATAGHVDHGKSTLVRALTGMEPDRWAEERRRGMTIDLGYAWTSLPSGAMLAFVDVPGHARFIGNLLAGLGPAPAVLVVVAADQGWRRQSTEHLAAVDALGLTSGLLAVTRSDLADPGPATADALQRVSRSSLGAVEAVAVSGTTGAGVDALRAALDRLVAAQPAPDVGAPVRLWVDRAFTVRGSGTVVTGTLSAGTLRVGDPLELRGRVVRVRALQSLGAPYDEVRATARVAVNLRGVERGDVDRGDALLTPGAWREATTLDVRLSTDARALPGELLLHVGAAAVPVRVRPLDSGTARLVMARRLPLRAGDRALLRDPAAQVVAAGVTVLDADPPDLRRRGSAVARAAALASASATPVAAQEVARRGAMRRADLAALGAPLDDLGALRDEGGWLVDQQQWQSWRRQLLEAVQAHAAQAPLDAGLPAEAARRLLGVPDLRLLSSLAAAAGISASGGRLHLVGEASDLGPAEAGISALEEQLRADPFAAPGQPVLAALSLGVRELAAAERAGRLLRVSRDVVLLPDGPQLAVRVLAELPQPFTLGAARQALGTSRRVAVPLLEHLDRRGWTRRLPGDVREVRLPGERRPSGAGGPSP